MVKKEARKKSLEAVENSSERAFLETLFFDFHSSRWQVYKMNFVRGIFFGFGSVLGGTLVVALVVSMLGFLTDVPGGLGDFIQYIVDTVNQSQYQ